MLQELGNSKVKQNPGNIEYEVISIFSVKQMQQRNSVAFMRSLSLSLSLHRPLSAKMFAASDPVSVSQMDHFTLAACHIVGW